MHDCSRTCHEPSSASRANVNVQCGSSDPAQSGPRAGIASRNSARALSLVSDAFFPSLRRSSVASLSSESPPKTDDRRVD